MIYLITGIGTLGSALARRLLREGHKVRSYSRNEHMIKAFQQSLSPKENALYSPIVGAVEDIYRLRRACHFVDVLIHTAAMKTVDLVEYNPIPAVRTNIDGTINVIEAVLDCNVKRAIMISSDKARAPSTLYGATKLVGERLWLGSNKYRGAQGNVFSLVAYGNVWASKGAVCHEWRRQAKEDRCLLITDPKMTRFHITIDQAVEFVLRAVQKIAPGTYWVPKLPVYRLGDLAEAFCRVYHMEYPKNTRVVGRRPAEKIHEELITENESPYIIAEDEWHFVLNPLRLSQEGGWKYCSSSSKAKRLSVSYLETLTREWAKKIGDQV